MASGARRDVSDPVDGTVSARRGVWFEVACGAAALIALAFLLVGAARSHDWPSLGAVVLFSLLLVAAENAAVLAPSTVGVSPAFMVVMASIAAYGHHGVALGAAITGLGGGIALRSIVQRKFRIVAFNCFQYSIAAVALPNLQRHGGVTYVLAVGSVRCEHGSERVMTGCDHIDRCGETRDVIQEKARPLFDKPATLRRLPARRVAWIGMGEHRRRRLA